MVGTEPSHCREGLQTSIVTFDAEDSILGIALFNYIECCIISKKMPSLQLAFRS